MLRETVTVSFGEGNSAVNVAWEHGDVDGKQDTENAYSDFCFNSKFFSLITISRDMHVLYNISDIYIIQCSGKL